MPKLPKNRITIANVMLLIAGIALILGLVMNPGFGSGLISLALLGLTVILAVCLGLRQSMALTFGLSCPACLSLGLQRRSILSFGDRFYLCPKCGLRCRQSLIGAILGLYLWSDASGEEYDAYYEKTRTQDPWNHPPGLEDQYEEAVSKTHANLVRNKRQRTPENPNGPGLE